MPHPVIRPMLEHDSDEVHRLAALLGDRTTREAMACRIAALRASPRHFLAVAAPGGGWLDGWISAERRILLSGGERVEITGLVVDAAARRSGTGRALVASVERWCLDCGLDTVTVRSNVTREASHAFYRNAGFRRIKTQHVYRRRWTPETGPRD